MQFCNFLRRKKVIEIAFLITNRHNQDILENVFNIFWQKGSYNKNPTSRTIRTYVRSNCFFFSICTSTGTNCEHPKKPMTLTIQFDIVVPLATNTDIILDISFDTESNIYKSNNLNQLQVVWFYSVW